MNIYRLLAKETFNINSTHLTVARKKVISAALVYISLTTAALALQQPSPLKPLHISNGLFSEFIQNLGEGDIVCTVAALETIGEFCAWIPVSIFAETQICNSCIIRLDDTESKEIRAGCFKTLGAIFGRCLLEYQNSILYPVWNDKFFAHYTYLRNDVDDPSSLLTEFVEV